ncbi:MAG: hypothetical protein HGB08_02280 [Candidatus Moranbacteria bacterium]|nr:hypothetical protein [Candidatus Moranbacteria bacterium]
MKDLAREMWKCIKVFIHYKKINFSTRLAYRFNFLLIALAVIFQIFFNLVFIQIIFGWVKNIKGWNYYEVLLVVGTVMLLDGLMWSSFAFMSVLKMHIKQGTLDGLIVKPMDTQYLVSIYRGDLEDTARIIIALGIIVFCIKNISIGWMSLSLNLCWYLITVICGWVIIYSISVMLNAISFWTIETASSFNLADTIVRSSQYPIDIFGNKFIRYSLTFILPLGFLGTFQARIFSRGFDPLLVAGSIVMAVIFFSISRLIWNKGLAKYSSASS